MGFTDNSLSSSKISSTFITRGYPGEYGWKTNYRKITSIIAPVPFESSTAIPQEVFVRDGQNTSSKVTDFRRMMFLNFAKAFDSICLTLSLVRLNRLPMASNV